MILKPGLKFTNSSGATITILETPYLKIWTALVEMHGTSYVPNKQRFTELFLSEAIEEGWWTVLPSENKLITFRRTSEEC